MAKIVIYTTPYCPYCIRAKQLLQLKNLEYEEIDVSTDSSLRQKMQQLSGGNTVPQIFIHQKPIGGCDDLYALERNHQLDTLINNH
ncbi:MAG: glutaredoxin 3 [Gammaproteobacteria bacterium CG22_combo_CG10-13_8_21_14_all_40_8]|nr:MAG: glutaredoxin 3 [Gammaproteobacteria bacterium CG22_combo_CG10-13_8_21_14_all_40_8]